MRAVEGCHPDLHGLMYSNVLLTGTLTHAMRGLLMLVLLLLGCFHVDNLGHSSKPCTASSETSRHCLLAC